MIDGDERAILGPDRVVHIGTFSKTLCPSIRIGYLVLPPELIYRGRALKWRSDLHNETASQLALAEFIENGHYQRHLSRMKKHYRQRREATVAALEEAFNHRVRIMGSATGLHLTAQFRDVCFSTALLKRIEDAGAKFYPVSLHEIVSGQHRDKLIVGYGNLGTEAIGKGIAILKQILG